MIEKDIELFKRYGIKVPRYAVLKGSSRKKVFSAERYVIKGYSKKFTHKTNIGAVRMNIPPEKLMVEVQRLKNKLQKYDVEEILVQEMIPRGIEIIVGAKRDPSFGDVVLFGLGGISVELWKDVSIRLCPVSDRDVEEMINETKAKEVLEGFRGGPKIDHKIIKEIIKKVCKIMKENKDIKEIDLNPIIVYPDGYYAVDIRVIR